MICVPGPCRHHTVSSGLPSGRFCFEGFLPVKGKERRQRLEQIATEPRTTVLYEAPPAAATQSLAEHRGSERPLQVARELTKRHEQQVGPTIAAALDHFQSLRPQGNSPCARGCPERAPSEPDDQELLARLQQRIGEVASPSDAARQLSLETGISRRRLYSLLHQEPSD